MTAKNKDENKRNNTSDKGKKSAPPPKNYNIRLKNAEDVRRMISVALNDLRRGNVEVNICRTLIYGGQVLINVFQQVNFEERLARLEARDNYGG